MKLFSRASLALLATLSIAFAKDLKFVVYGDTRDGHAVHRKLVKMIMAEHPDLVLQTDLSKNENAKAVFVFFHVPPYSVGTVHGPDLEIRKALCPLFEKYHVTAVFNGHEHIYYRTVRNGIPYIIAGGGGAPLYPIDPGLAEKGDVYASVHHYCVCEISGNTMRLRTFTDKGKKIDEATIPLRAR